MTGGIGVGGTLQSELTPPPTGVIKPPFKHTCSCGSNRSVLEGLSSCCRGHRSSRSIQARACLHDLLDCTGDQRTDSFRRPVSE
ncbi:unnamed protein product [Ilex paraguariensis]|uniref:Uncharacterized protein n=1 Tax=Ilex paraguariensis TaxID=185542 RepID=A0ABC8RQY0_9AQUA